jgi:hypothetical protein
MLINPKMLTQREYFFIRASLRTVKSELKPNAQNKAIKHYDADDLLSAIMEFNPLREDSKETRDGLIKKVKEIINEV